MTESRELAVASEPRKELTESCVCSPRIAGGSPPPPIEAAAFTEPTVEGEPLPPPPLLALQTVSVLQERLLRKLLLFPEPSFVSFEEEKRTDADRLLLLAFMAKSAALFPLSLSTLFEL